MKKIGWLFAACCAMLLIGCARIELNMRFKPDGTGEKEMIVAIDKDALTLMASGNTDPLKDIEMDMRKDPTAIVSRFQDGNLIGFKAIAPITGSTKLNERAWKGEFAVDNGLFWRDYKMDLDADLALDGSDKTTAAFLSKVDFKVSVELPTKPTTHNGQADDSGKKISWTLVPGRKDHLTLQAREYRTGRLVATGVGVLALGAGAFMWFRRRKPSDTSIVA